VPNRIDIRASKSENIGTTLQRSLSALRANRIEVLAAAEIINAHTTPFARILLRQVSDKPRALQVLKVEGIDAHPVVP